MEGRGISVGKCIMRSLVCLSMICVGLTIPKFGKILNLVGAATVSTTSFMFPPIFYLRLANQLHREDAHSQYGQISLKTKSICAFIALLGLVGGVIGTYS